MVLVYVLSGIMMKYTISYRETRYLVNRSWHSLLCFTDQTSDSCLTQPWIFIHHAYVFIHHITNTIQKRLLYVIQFQFIYVPVSIHDSIQLVIGTQQNGQPARSYHAPKHVLFVSKMFLTRKSVTNRPCWVLYTPYSQCQSTTRKSNTLLWLNVIGHISFAPVEWNTLQLTVHNDLQTITNTNSTDQIFRCDNTQFSRSHC